ncbi:amino acid permease [Aeromicrobium sp. 636]|uniref:Amino acid permease n=1 Tax=Aeromicrobium senzhongii TaxID=2663859 RepID=A0A8I0EV33_9ACTN|nr:MULTISPECIES: basic amino acid/polyamine antiporter [Aeromicrobium]MBC9225647.1 amino acid permease [Aeromicrobium senzhongii]MCQ3997756.1 amino acid permease [Aeromicrobium sp. 636]
MGEAGTTTHHSTVTKVGRPVLTAMVIGSMVGGGVFSLPGGFATTTGVAGALIAWTLAGTGMLMLALCFQNLALRRPELDAGVFVYAKAGFGDYVGFNSAIGYWASGVAGNAFYWVFITATIGAFLPGFGSGGTLLAVAVSTVGVWVFHFLIARGVRDAAVVNRIVTICKLVPILVFVVVLATQFDPEVFRANFLARDELGSLTDQVKNTMIITTFVFIGVEGASVYSRHAQRREDVGTATVLGFLSVLALFALVTMVSYGAFDRSRIAQTREPSMVGLFEGVVGPWGEWFVSAGVVVSVLGAYLAWTLMAAEVMHAPARAEDMPAALGRENDHGTPVGALLATTVGAQVLLGLTLLISDSLDFMLALSTCMVLVPYLLAAAYALKLAVTGETYEHDARHRRRHAVIAVLAVAYAIFLFVAAGPPFLLLSCLVYAPAALLYVRARTERGRRIFTRAELVLFLIICVGAIAGVYTLVTGGIDV